MLKSIKEFDEELDKTEILNDEEKSKLKANYEENNKEYNYLKKNNCKLSSSLEAQYLEQTDNNVTSEKDQTNDASSLTYSYVVLIISLIFSFLNVF